MEPDKEEEKIRKAMVKPVESALASLRSIDQTTLTDPEKERLKVVSEKVERLGASVAAAVTRKKQFAVIPMAIPRIAKSAQALSRTADILRGIDRTSLDARQRASINALELRAQSLMHEVSFAVTRRPGGGSSPAGKKIAAAKKSAARKKKPGL